MDDKSRRRGGLIDHANNAASFLQNALLAKRVITKAVPVNWFLGLVLGSILIFTIVIVFSTGGQGQASETTPSPSTTQPVVNDFSTLFKTTNNGDGISDPDFYNLLKNALSNQTYSKLITQGGVFNVEFYPSLDNFVGCQALVQRDTIKFYGLSLCNIPNQKYLASHEAGHIIENRNGRLYQSFPHSDLTQEDSGCYSSLGFLKSYFYAESGAGTNPFEESFAEAVALYLMPNERKPLTSFQTQCPNTYNWVRDNIFK